MVVLLVMADTDMELVQPDTAVPVWDMLLAHAMLLAVHTGHTAMSHTRQ